MKKALIPKAVRRLFWDIDSASLDIQKKSGVIIDRVLNYGTLTDWEWLFATYGEATIRKRINARDKFGRNNIREESRRLASHFV